ncbi:MAG: hypothetical protein KGO49_10520, partial [Gammaproteobacteria bacterium]|nr:hypothetical protein [Gammaproteobacteria bacterium]
MTADRIIYNYKISKSKKGIIAVYIGIDCAGFDFSINRMKWFNRFFKSLGFGFMQSLTNQDLNNDIYVYSDDSRVYSALSSDQAVLSSVTEI